FLVAPGNAVAKGEDLVQMEDPFKQAKLRDSEAKVSEIEARLRAAEARSPFDTVGLTHQRELVVKELEDIQRRDHDLVMRSPAAGTFVVPHALDLADNFIKQGQSIGYVMADGAVSIRVSVPESQIEYVRDQTKSVAIRFDDSPWSQIDDVRITRQVPESSHKLPSPALATANGGPLDLDPNAKDRDKLIEPIFEIDLSLPREYAVGRWGQRVWVRFDHGASPVIGRLYRAARQLFLGRFHV